MILSEDAVREADALCAFINASPSPFHAVSAAADMLTAAGFAATAQAESWVDPDRPVPARGFLTREGALVAWDLGAPDPAQCPPWTSYRIIAAHTDSPNLRIKPRPDLIRGGWEQLSVEVYGGPLLNSWLDRDLGLSGAVTVRAGGSGSGGVERVLFRVDDPVLRVPQLAVHLERSVNEEGLRLNPQTHLVPIWGAGGDAPGFAEYLSEQVGCAPGDLLGWDAMTHDLTPARRVGRAGDLIAAARQDNLTSCHAAIRALVEAGARRGEGGPAPVAVVALFDHEEIGSTTERGAASPLLSAVLERLVLARAGTRDDLWRALAGTVVASADMAHAVHPNYPERHEPQHQPMVNAGPVMKVNSRGRYATDSLGGAVLTLAAQQAGVPLQVFLSRGDMPCGSTVGPLVAAGLGVSTVDVGSPMLAMHSARELAGSADQRWYVELLTAFLTPS